ncbi:hypothetical protein [Phaeocystidibacter marisrubri]|nr:hypothetical protein [Phaeocystidibacter marisrubri]GGH70498.1 hypothetical protein GCM10011318_12570 [Phaeocystidibacter marisrubri]
MDNQKETTNEVSEATVTTSVNSGQEEVLEATIDTSTTPNQPSLDPETIRAYEEKIRAEQNLPMAIVAGLVAALVSSAVWALVTIKAESQIGWMAVGVGFLVGYAVRYMGKGIDNTFGVIGAVFALLGCVLGNIFSVYGFVTVEFDVTFMESLSAIPLGEVINVLIDDLSPYDFLFYGIALYEGFKFSFRQITQEEVIQNSQG